MRGRLFLSKDFVSFVRALFVGCSGNVPYPKVLKVDSVFFSITFCTASISV